MVQNNYSGTVTEDGLEGIRRHLEMYIDSTDTLSDKHAPIGLTHLAQELVSNVTDEYLNGFGHTAKIVIHQDGSMTVSDHGRGLVKGEKDSFEDIIRNATEAHTSGKFAENAGYQARGIAGMHGIGLKATNAGSKWLTIHAISSAVKGRNTKTTKAVRTGGYDEYEITFHNVSPDYETKLIHHWEPDEVEPIIPTDESRGSNQFKVKATGEVITTGSTITFLPDDGPVAPDVDKKVFGSTKWVDDDLLPIFEAAAFLNKGFIVDFTDERYIVDDPTTDDSGDGDDTSKQKFYHQHYEYPHGIKDYIKVLSEGQPVFSGMREPLTLDGQLKYSDGLDYDLQGELLFTNDLTTTILSYANGVPTAEGGPHLEGFKQAIVKALTDYAIERKKIKSSDSYDESVILEGVTAVFEFRAPMSVSKFEGQTKGKFAVNQAKPIARDIVTNALNKWIYSHEKQADALLKQIAESQQARTDLLKKKREQRAASKLKNDVGSTFVSPKLKAASGTDPEKLELFITEGDSASNIGRNPKTQAVFPLRGNLKNIMDLSLTQALANDEISTIANVIGAGIGPSFNVDDMQYHKVICTTDADSDGAHIRALIATLFFRFFPGLIEAGRLYYVKAPLYKATKYVNGNPHIRMFFSEQEIAQHRDELQGWDIQRYKGLGEMNTDEAHDAIVNPETRHLIRFTIDDHAQAAKTLRILMGEKASLRKDWIAHSLDFKDLYQKQLETGD